MADSAIERRLRRAFSHREKARQLERECARAFDAGEIESARYASLREFYGNHIHQAETDLRSLRDEIQARRASYLEQFRAVNEAQGTLSEQLSAGTIKPQAANRENRKLMTSADACRKAMAECDRLLATSSSDDFGGPIDLPLAGFVEPAAKLDEQEDNAFDWERAAAFALPFLIAATVFLPWLTLEGATKSLPSLDDFGRVLGLPQAFGPIPARLAWIAYLVLPLAALPFAAMSRNRPAGYALIVCGFLLIWVMLMGILGLPMVSTAPEITLTAVIRALHLGPFLYFGGAIGLIILGHRRAQKRELSTESGSRAILIMSACMIFLMVVAASAVWMQAQEGFVSYDARLVDTRTGAVNIVLSNEGRVQAAVFAPWPGGAPGREPATAATDGDVYGLAVHVRERGTDEFRLLPDSRGAWLSAGLPMRGDDPILVPPRSRTVLTLAPWHLRALGVDPDAVRIYFTRRAGEILGQTEHELPDLRAEPGTPMRYPVPRRLPDTPFPDSPERVAPAPGEPEYEEVSPAPAPAPTPTGPHVTFTGIMGDRAALRVTPPGEAAERIIRGRDEPIAGDWVLLEIGVAPPSATLFNESTFETVVLRMGEGTTLTE